ncbi:MAG: protease inhibitor I42 family protein [Mycobacterium sp.]
MNSRSAALLAMAILSSSLMASSLMGCAAGSDPRESGPQTTTIEMSYDDLLDQKNITRTLTLNLGDTLQISLGSNPSTGFRWTPQMQITDPTVLAQAGHEVLGPSVARPGAAGREVWALQAIGPGATTVSTTYDRPWSGGEKDSWTFSAEVTVD